MTLSYKVDQLINGKANIPCICREFELKPTNFAKYICSLANTDGGYIIIGATRNGDNYHINGISSKYNFPNIINASIKLLSSLPQINYDVVSINNKNLFAIEVLHSKNNIFFEGSKYILEESEIVKCKGVIMMDMSKVFIVHGHDDSAKEKAARFIEKIGLEAIILHEQVNAGLTIIEKLEENTNVGFAIVLYTPCDLGKAKGGQNMSPRARQNVVFEHGYLFGKLGRKNVCALVKGDIEKPTDISGVIYIQMDDNEAWKMNLAKEMKNAGYEIDFNTLL